MRIPLRTTITLPIAALLLGAVWVAPPAAAEAACFEQATGDVHKATGQTETSGTAAFPRADVTEVCAEITSGVVRLSLRVLEPTNPATDPAWTGDTNIEWTLQHPDDPFAFAAVVTYRANRNQVGNERTGAAIEGAQVRERSTYDIGCQATASYDGSSYIATFPSSCIGELATKFEFSAGFAYDPYPCHVITDATPGYGDGTRGPNKTQHFEGPVTPGDGTAPSAAEMPDAEADICRLAGADRYTTAVAASAAAWPHHSNIGAARVVVLARGDAFPDALAGTPLAAAKKGPLLLTPPTSLSPVAANEIKRVLPPGQAVFLLGGTAALSDGVAKAVKDLGFNPVRLAGSDRYATAYTISYQIAQPTRIFLATGLSFPSALVAGVAAGSTGGVVMLTADGKMPSATATYIKDRPGVARTAVGREASTADPNAESIVGADKYDTSRLVAERFWGEFPRFAGVASGTVFADALAGGAHIGKAGNGPLLLSEPGALPAPVSGYLRAHPAIRRAYLYGGPSALSQSVRDAVRNNINGR